MLVKTGLEPVLSQTEKSSKPSNNKQFSMNIKTHKIITSFVSPGLRPLSANKNGRNLVIFHFDIRGKLSTYNTTR